MAKKTRREDANQTAFRTLQEATGEKPKTPPVEPPDPTKNPAAVSLSKLGSSKGGKARAKALDPKKRAEIAKKAAEMRWAAKSDED